MLNVERKRKHSDVYHADPNYAAYNGLVEYTAAAPVIAPPRQSRTNRHSSYQSSHQSSHLSSYNYNQQEPPRVQAHSAHPEKRHRSHRHHRHQPLTLEPVVIPDAPESEGDLSDTGADVGEISVDDSGDNLSRKFNTFNAALADLLSEVDDKPELSYPLLNRILGRDRSGFVKTMKAMQLEGTLPWLCNPRSAPTPQPKASNKRQRETSRSVSVESHDNSTIRAGSVEPGSRKVSGASTARSVSTTSSVPPVPFANPTIEPGLKVKKAKIWPPELPEIKNPDILRQVYSHKSVVDGATSLIGSEAVHNERLEFLGDSYLGAIVTRHIFSRFPTLREGAMTTIRSTIVGNKNLHAYGLAYNFDKKLIAGGNKTAELLARQKTLADLFEAYIGGLLLDRGPDVVDSWLQDLIEPKMKEMAEEHQSRKPLNKAAKNDLANYVGGKNVIIDYRWTDGGGGNQGGYEYTIFFTGWGIQEKSLGSGWGPNKTDASIRAAMNVLEEKKILQEVKRAKERWYEEHPPPALSVASVSDTGTVIRHNIP